MRFHLDKQKPDGSLVVLRAATEPAGYIERTAFGALLPVLKTVCAARCAASRSDLPPPHSDAERLHGLTTGE